MSWAWGTIVDTIAATRIHTNFEPREAPRSHTLSTYSAFPSDDRTCITQLTPHQLQPMTNSRLQAFFILGSPRSGTSLLSRMIDSHENLVVPNESLVFKMFSPALSLYGDLDRRSNQERLLRDVLSTRVIQYWTPPATFDEIAPLIHHSGFAGVIEALIRSRARHEDLRAWGEKSPGHAYYWQVIRTIFPEAKVIHILRDGRDVASSIVKARMGPASYYAAGRMWCDYLDKIEHIRSCSREDTFFELRYEELLSEPAIHLRRICEFLGVPYSESMLRFHKTDTNYQTDATNLENLTKPLIVSNKEKWRKNLTERQLLEFESVAGDHLDKYGYGRAHSSRRLGAGRLFFARYVRSPALRVFSRAKDIQGQREFVNIQWIRLRRRIVNIFRRVAG